MKRFYLKNLALLIIMAGLMLTSCKKEEDTPAEENNTTVTKTFVVKLKIDNNAEIVFKKGTAMVMVDKIVIGTNSGNKDIQFSMNKDIATGVYTQDFLISYGLNSNAAFSTATNATSSSLTITKHDKGSKHIKGTYSVNYKDNNDQSPHVATGSFDINYK